MTKTVLRGLALSLLSVASTALTAHAQAMSAADMKAMDAHMQMTRLRSKNAADSLRAAATVTELRSAISKYKDVDVAIADGFRQFAPQIKQQPVYHFTNYKWALENTFRFNAQKPTSLLYKKDVNGSFVLIGAMYTAPKRASEEDLNRRVPLSVAQWHKHVNWCLPPSGDDSAWLTKKDGHAVFGPLGVSTVTECNAAGGRFQKEVFGWMVHANVFASNDPEVIWHDDHGMSGDEMVDHDHD